MKNLGDFRMSYGQYGPNGVHGGKEGECLDTLWALDKEYLKWIAYKSIPRSRIQECAKSTVREYLKEKKDAGEK